MEKLSVLKKWCVRLAVGLAVFTPVFMAVSALGARFGLWNWWYAFGTLVRNYGVKLMFSTLAVAALALILSLIIKPRARKGIVLSVLALCVPLIGMAHGKNVQKTAGSLPFIHDITTDTQDVPTFSSVIVGQRGEGSNTLDYIGKVDKKSKKLVSVLQVESYPDIRTIVLSDAPEATYARVLATAKSMGWIIASASEATGSVEATASSFWFGFKDDVVMRIRPAEGGGSLVDVRSISRVGGSDIGANANRIRQFRNKLGN